MIDIFYKYVESISSSLCSWAWRKRWGNRQNGTGYKTPDKARVLPVPDYIEERRSAYSKAMEKKT